MGNFIDQWRIRLESGQVKGPYSTTAINKMIVEGVYTGNEFICAFPDGDWKPLSKQPEFYEAQLESLENPNQRDEKISQKMDDTIGYFVGGTKGFVQPLRAYLVEAGYNRKEVKTESYD